MTLGSQKVVRTFDEEGAGWFLAARDARLLDDLRSEELVVHFEVAAESPLTVESDRVPVVTYPYEWSPTMLRDAALLTLDVADRAWDREFHLRDASAFNIVFDQGVPVLVDLGSFRPGHTPFWLAYGQFCDHFLNPLVLAETTGVSPRMVWSGSLEGLPAQQLRALAGRRVMKPRYIRHIWIRAGLEERSSTMPAAERSSLRKDFGLPPEAIAKTYRGLHRLIERIDVSPAGVWESYEADNTYSSVEAEVKTDFVYHVASMLGPGRMAVDVGANTGRFSAVLADHFATVVAIEPDEATLDLLYRRQRADELPLNIRPLVADILDPSGGRGFLNAERVSLHNRLAGADLVAWLAVLHHLVVGRNLPLALFVDLMAELGRHHIVEHVAPDDEMSQLLLSSREEEPWPFGVADFEAGVAGRFAIREAVQVSPGRRLYHLELR